MTVGEKIRQVRKAAKKTQVEVAEKAGIAVNSLRLYEAGKRQPNLETLQKIADALNVYQPDLLPDELLAFYNAGYDDGSVATDYENYKKLSHDFVIPHNAMLQALAALSRLNELGQLEAIKRIEELAEISKYKRKPESGQDGI